MRTPRLFPCVRWRRLAAFVLALAALATGVAVAIPPPALVTHTYHPVGAGPKDTVADTTVGLEAHILYHYKGPLLQIRASRDFHFPLRMRLISVKTSGDAGDDRVYDLRVIAMYSGTYDVARFLRRVDGEPTVGLPHAKIYAADTLPRDATLRLEEFPGVAAAVLGRYRVYVAIAIGLWLVPVAIGLLFWFMRPPKLAPASTAEPWGLSLADQLRPIIDRILAGTADAEEQALLERLLLAYWRHRLGLVDLDHERSLARLREHAEAGVLLAQLEGWLHRPPAARQATAEDIAAWLTPYKTVKAIDMPTPKRVIAMRELAAVGVMDERDDFASDIAPGGTDFDAFRVPGSVNTAGAASAGDPPAPEGFR